MCGCNTRRLVGLGCLRGLRSRAIREDEAIGVGGEGAVDVGAEDDSGGWLNWQLAMMHALRRLSIMRQWLKA